MGKPNQASDESTLTLLDRYPATPEGHMKFLEWVRDEVKFATDAKRNQYARNYSYQTICQMVSGIKWDEAKIRLSMLDGVSSIASAAVSEVLQWNLSVETLEQIDEMLRPRMGKAASKFSIRFAGRCRCH